MLAKTPIGNRFYQWVNSKHPRHRYLWTDNCDCACGRYLIEEMGLKSQEVRAALEFIDHPRMTLRPPNKDAIEVWYLFNWLAYGDGLGDKSWTFGKLAKRIAMKYPEFV